MALFYHFYKNYFYMKKIYSLFGILFFAGNVFAQNVGIGTTTPNASALLELQSTNKGLLLPRVTDTNAVPSPAKGLLIFANATNSAWFYDGAKWQETVKDNLWTKYQDSIAITQKKYVGVNTDYSVYPTKQGIQANGSLLMHQEMLYTKAAPTVAQTYTMNNTSTTITPSDSIVRIFDPGGANSPYTNNNQGNIALFTVGSPTGFQISFNSADFGIAAGDTLWISNTSFPACRTNYFQRFTNIAVAPTSFTTNIISSTTFIIFRSNADNINSNGFDITCKALYPKTTIEPKITPVGNALIYDGAIGSFSVGRNTNASGFYSAAMGNGTIASGGISTAMGDNTIASGAYATAMGYQSRAIADFSTAMGHLSIARGDASTAMGFYTDASASYSTAMGFYTDASEFYSTAMGRLTEASGNAATAMGNLTNATAPNSTAMGNVTTASNNNATAMGSFTMASGSNSTAMGETTIASGITSTSLGSNTIASGGISTAMGSTTVASGAFSTAMGGNTTATGQHSTAMGSYTTASGFVSTAMGNGSTASGNGSTAMGRVTTARAYSSTAIGSYNDSIISSNPTTWVNTDPLLYIGNSQNGTPRSNAMVVYKNANVDINGFTRLGNASENAPIIKMKKLIIPVGPAVDGFDSYPMGSGITDAKVIGVQIFVTYANPWKIPASYRDAVGYEFNYQVQSNNIVIINKAGNSVNIGGKAFTVLITYEE
jgi:Head domain of trimeric autotransporter adhesin